MSTPKFFLRKYPPRSSPFRRGYARTFLQKRERREVFLSKIRFTGRVFAPPLFVVRRSYERDCRERRSYESFV